jgi:flagellar motor switch protein FliN
MVTLAGDRAPPKRRVPPMAGAFCMRVCASLGEPVRTAATVPAQASRFSARLSTPSLLQLAQGSVIELDKLAGEPMEVMVNNKLVARGEVVVVNEKFGIRLTDVVSAAERVQQLR